MLLFGPALLNLLDHAPILSVPVCASGA